MYGRVISKLPSCLRSSNEPRSLSFLVGNCLQNCVRDLRIKIANGEQLKATDAFQPGLGFGQQDIKGVLDASPSNGGILS